LIGGAEVALVFEDTLTAIKLARDAGIQILGGDVYVRRAGRLVLAYANWHTDKQQGESEEDYARRTWEESEAYLQRYPKSAEEPLFVLVVATDHYTNKPDP
jgi:hypothetical protein